MTHFDCIITGGGVVGLTAAVAMEKLGYTVGLFDGGLLEHESNTEDLRVYAINQTSLKFLTELGVWDFIDNTQVSPYRHMQVWDGISQSEISFDSRLIAKDALGVIVQERVLKNVLLEKIKQFPRITLLPLTPVETVNTAENSISINSQFSARLLIVAEGANSETRKQLKVKLTSWSYQQQAIIATIATELSHQQTARQVFLPQGPLAFLPLAQQHCCSIVWSTTPEHAEQLLAMEDPAFNQALNDAFGKSLGEIKIISKRLSFPLKMRHTRQYAGQNWVLMGDAAHTIHPLAGLGLNVGLADVQALMDCVKDTGCLASSKTLGRYQRQRKHEVWQIIAAMEMFKRLFSTESKPVVALRSLGLTLCNQLPLVKQFFVRQAG